ncbi:hypothetical protein L596_017378 [Steinernema carpocapsae]|uniref:Peptidase S1 domain-containing protein n=1 Tax=Steinernema carpocapsae TaxID=34508 RepID=A0A4U5N1U9_STECR|nr:hypothetical protein L596_017378 [Steinernema carpocapsae]
MRLFVTFLGLLAVALAAPPFPGQLGRLIKTDKIKIPPPDELVFGGEKAYQGLFPFYVSVRLHFGNAIGSCGGSLLTPRHVLTAAHCNTKPFTNDSIVIMGLDTRKEDPYTTHGVQVRNVISAVNHKDFNKPHSLSNDLAVLTLDKPFNLTNYVQLINIPIDDSELQKQYWATVCGFGPYKLENKTLYYSDNLLYAYIPLIDSEKCEKRWSQLDEHTQICAGLNGTGSGPGDSGGPLFMPRGGKNWQIGVVSFGSGRARELANQADHPAVYVRASSYCPWLTEKTNGEFQCGNANCKMY